MSAPSGGQFILTIDEVRRYDGYDCQFDERRVLVVAGDRTYGMEARIAAQWAEDLRPGAQIKITWTVVS
jgi:hypothetical protein